MIHKNKFLFIALFVLGASSSLMASKRILVDLAQQVAVAYQDGRILFYGRISTGKEGRRTPTGSFHVREKDIDHISNLWPQPNGGAKMHYMLRITKDGVAMHLGPTPDYPASHGCIRMQDGFAQKMFAWADKWTPVDIVGTPPEHSPAVALSSLARSRSMLRRSIGGGTGRAIDIMSSNPKLHTKPKPLALDPVEPIAVYRSKHLSAFNALSTNPKDHKTVTRKATNTIRKKVRKKRVPRDPHPDPLKAVRGR